VASTSPAPRPKGIAYKQIITKEFATENPMRATAVIPMLFDVTRPVPSFRFNRSGRRLERIVPPAMIIETMPAKDRGTANTSPITGQAEPGRESGKPRLTKAT